jgi:xanthine dehydrogenase YagS FAD-binding subunit
MQRTRCAYFYDTATPCNKRTPGSGCSAIDGLNRNHAILGTSTSCIATNPSDMSVALAALGALVHIAGPSGERTMALIDFHRLPGDTPHVDTNLEVGDASCFLEYDLCSSCAQGATTMDVDCVFAHARAPAVPGFVVSARPTH